MSEDDAQRARLRRATRMKQLNANLTTAGYALLAGGAWDPLLNGKLFGANQAVAIAVGLAMLGTAIYLAPEGEVSNVRP